MNLGITGKFAAKTRLNSSKRSELVREIDGNSSENLRYGGSEMEKSGKKTRDIRFYSEKN